HSHTAPFDGRTVLDALADAVVATDQSNTIVYANAMAHSLLGWPPGELVGRPLISLIPQRMRAEHETGFARYFSTMVPRLIGHKVRVPGLCRDGSEVQIELTLTAV